MRSGFQRRGQSKPSRNVRQPARRHIATLSERAMNEFPILETERLVLRRLEVSDEAGVLAIYSRTEVTRFCDVPTLSDPGQAGRLVSAFAGEFENHCGIRWAITRKGAPGLIGLCGVGWYRHNCSALLSYDLHPDYWGRGIMTESLRAVADYVLRPGGVNRISATTLVDNHASMRVLRRLGFQEEGILRDWACWKGEFKDLRCFSLLRRDWQAAESRPCIGASTLRACAELV